MNKKVFFLLVVISIFSLIACKDDSSVDIKNTFDPENDIILSLVDYENLGASNHIQYTVDIHNTSDHPLVSYKLYLNYPIISLMGKLENPFQLKFDGEDLNLLPGQKIRLELDFDKQLLQEVSSWYKDGPELLLEGYYQSLDPDNAFRIYGPLAMYDDQNLLVNKEKQTSIYSLSDFMPDSQMVKYFQGDIESGGSFKWLLPKDQSSYEVYYVTTMDSRHEVYEHIDETIVRTYYKGGEGGYKSGPEFYENHVILKGPLEVGQTWENKTHRGDVISHTITGVDLEMSYLGKDYDCIEVTTSRGNQLYFAPKLGFVELKTQAYPMKLAAFERNPLLPDTDEIDTILNYLDFLRPSTVYNDQWLVKMMSPKRQMVKFYSGDFENAGAVRIVTHLSEDGYEEIYGNSGLLQRRRYRFTAAGLVMDYRQHIEALKEIPLKSEAESNRNELLIKLPIKLGQKWETLDSYRTISQVPTQYNLKGDPSNYLEVTIETKDGFSYKEYYDQGLGLVKTTDSQGSYHSEVLGHQEKSFSTSISPQMIDDFVSEAIQLNEDE